MSFYLFIYLLLQFSFTKEKKKKTHNFTNKKDNIGDDYKE